jgi:hypothetical protein
MQVPLLVKGGKMVERKEVKINDLAPLVVYLPE